MSPCFRRTVFVNWDNWNGESILPLPLGYLLYNPHNILRAVTEGIQKFILEMMNTCRIRCFHKICVGGWRAPFDISAFV